MAVIWGLDIFLPWVDSWVEFTFKIIFNELVESGAYSVNILFLTAAKCILCLALAVTADVRNRKFNTYFMSLVIYAITPAFAIITIISRVAPLGFIFSWVAATYFVTTPLRFCCIFNQRPTAVPDHTRLVVACLGFTIALSNYFLTSNQKDFAQFPETFIIVVWIIKIPIFVLIITLTESIKHHLKKEVVTERTMKACFDGIKQDLTSAHRNKYIGQFILFVILLQPIHIITFIDRILETVNFEIDTFIDQKRAYKKLEHLAEMVSLPLLYVFLSFGKGVIGRFGDLVAIGVSHAFNALICLLLYLFLRDKQAAHQLALDEAYAGPAQPGHTSILIINGTERQYIVKTPFYETTRPVGEFYLSISLPTPSWIFNMTEEHDGGPALSQIVEVERNKRYRFLTFGTGKGISKLIQVTGDDEYEVRKGETAVLIMNGIVGETVNGINVPRDSKEHIAQIMLSPKHIVQLPLTPSDKFHKIFIPAGVVKCSYACQGDNKSCSAFPPSSIRVRMESFTEVTWVIANDGDTHMKLYSTLHISPEELEKINKVLTNSYSVSGLAKSAASIGYIQFFWTESPIRLRTTIFAIFLVFNELLSYITFILVTSVSASIALGCIGLSCFGFFVHVVIGLLYDNSFRRELWFYLNEPPKGGEGLDQSTI